MKTNQTLEEARKYLLYISDALHATAQAYSTDEEDRPILEKYASDIFEYSNGLEQLRNNIIAKEQSRKKMQVVAELESTYETKKRNTTKAANNLRIIKAVLETAKKAGVEKDIEEAKRRLAYYTQEHTVATQLEMNAKRDLEQGA